jgi:site-specific DNA-methyltransferase (adenine-specific)
VSSGVTLTPLAVELLEDAGYRFALRYEEGPRQEQILWVTKPAEPGPARANVLKWGAGAVNVDGCRVPYAGVDDTWALKHCTGLATTKFFSVGDTPRRDKEPVGTGRYPSNLLVTARALGDDSKYGDLDAWSQARGLSEEWLDAALSAGVLRVPKPSRSEKNAGCEGLDERKKPLMNEWAENPGRTTPKQSETPRANHHPTCKPVTLFAFLCTLACPRGGVVLDPFLGSGTTGVAARQCGMHFIGIEREPDYVAIAEARIADALRKRQPALPLDVAAG